MYVHTAQQWVEPDINQHSVEEVQSHNASSPEVGTTEDVADQWQRVSQFVCNNKQMSEWVL
jgi:hypothetical protein